MTIPIESDTKMFAVSTGLESIVRKLRRTYEANWIGQGRSRNTPMSARPRRTRNQARAITLAGRERIWRRDRGNLVVCSSSESRGTALSEWLGRPYRRGSRAAGAVSTAGARQRPNGSPRRVAGVETGRDETAFRGHGTFGRR